MAIRGLVRDFSDTKKNELKSVISNLDENNAGSWGSIKDGIGDILASVSRGHDFSRYNIQDHLDEIDAYQTEILDMKNMGVEKIDEIFSNVKAVDTSYAANFKSTVESMDKLKLIMSNLAGAFYVSEVNSNGCAIASENFSMDFYGLDELVEPYYYNLTHVNGAEGYNWDYIKELMNKDPGDLTEAEYKALIKLVDSFVQDNGELDIDNYNKFLESCYTKSDSLAEYLGVKTCTLNENAENLFEKYAYYHSTEMSEYIMENKGKINASDSEEDEIKAINFEKYNFNLQLFQELLSNNKKLTSIPPEGLKSGQWALTNYEDHYVYNKDIPIYLKKTVRANGTTATGLFDYSLMTSNSNCEFITYSSGESINNYINDLNESMLAATQTNAVLDLAINDGLVALGNLPSGIFSDAWSTAGADLSSYICLMMGSSNLNGALEHNAEVNLAVNAHETGKIMQFFDISGSLMISNNKLVVKSAYCDEDEIKTRLWLYEDTYYTDDKYKSLSFDDVQNTLSGTADSKSDFSGYFAWYNKSGTGKSLIEHYEQEINKSSSHFGKRYDEMTYDERINAIKELKAK